MKKKVKILLIALVITIFIFGIILLVIVNYSAAPYVTNVEISDSKRFNDQVIFNVEVGNNFFKLDKNVWCLITEDKTRPARDDERWVKANDGYCSFTVPSGDYNVYVKDKYGNINDIDSQKVEINKILEIKTNKDAIYMYKGRVENLKYELVTIGNVNEEVTWSSKNEDIASVDSNGKVTGLNYGVTDIVLTTENGLSKNVTVYVSSFITKPVINFNKPYISCGQFSKEDNELIDKILFDRINDAGYKTRAGVIAAARFLALEFNYRVHYFSENGRLDNYAPYKHVDGEGRYYHRGLYLNEYKFAELEKGASLVGPATWGCKIEMFVKLPQYTYGNKYPNGLDCSGFVSWALLNGGFDIGDKGAGENKDHDDLDDLGTKVKITAELMNSGKVKVGDLIGNNGHMAILAGWDDKNYYIAESLNTTAGVVMTTVPKNKLLSSSLYKHIILMDDVYKEDGNYTNMW